MPKRDTGAGPAPGSPPADRSALAAVPHGRAPIYRAIDGLTGALLTVERRRRRAEAAGEAGNAADLRRVEQELRDLGACLLALRDGAA